MAELCGRRRGEGRSVESERESKRERGSRTLNSGVSSGITRMAIIFDAILGK